MKPAKQMTDEQDTRLELLIGDAVRAGKINGKAKGVWFGILRTWRTGKELSTAQRMWLGTLAKMARQKDVPDEPLVEDDHG